MSRDLTTAALNAASAATVRPVALWYGDFASGAVRVTSYIRDITWGGHTWTALGQLVGFEEIRETGTVYATGAVFTLNGVPSSLVTKALEAGYRRRRCSLYLAFLDDSGAVIADPIEWRYLMDRMTIADNGTDARITVRAESRLVDLQRAREIRHTDQGQQAVFAGDRFFEYVPGLANREIVVGGTVVGTRPAGSPGNSPVDTDPSNNFPE